MRKIYYLIKRTMRKEFILRRFFILSAIAAMCMLYAGCDKNGIKTEKKAEQKVSEKGFEIMTDFEVAKSQAKINNKPILLVFSGSDWCGWCVKLDNEVFSTDEFKKWAAENVIFVVADFPARKELPAELAKQNQMLQKTYDVQGFPTVLLLKDDGSVIFRTGYQRGGAEVYIEHLKPYVSGHK